jgi:HemX protein
LLPGGVRIHGRSRPGPARPGRAPRVVRGHGENQGTFDTSLTELVHVLALLLYAAAAALTGSALLRRQSRLPAFGTSVAALGVVVHVAALALYVAHWRELPLVGLGPSLSSLAFLVAAGSLLVVSVGRVGPLGLVLLPVVAILLGASLLVGIRPMGEPTTFRGFWFVLHVLLAFSGYFGLTVAFAAGLMYLLQFRELKSKRFGAIFHVFPPLDTLDRIGRWALLGGFLALSLALLLGGAWAMRFPGPGAPGNPHVAWGVLTWIVFVVVLLARAGRGRAGRRGALASVVGFAVVVLAFLLLRGYLPQGGAFL